MSEVSTRIWLDEGLWDELRRRAIRERVLVRELIPRLLAQNAVAAVRAAVPPPPVAPPAATAPAAPPPAQASAPIDDGPPVVPMAEVYRCGVCGAEIKLGAVSQHINRHLKEAQAAEAARS